MKENLFNRLVESMEEFNQDGSNETAAHQSEPLIGEVIESNKHQKLFKSLSAALDYAMWAQPSSLAINAVQQANGSVVWVLDYMNSNGKQ